MKSDNYKLQFITHYNNRYTYTDSARLALEGGCRWVQLRMKGVDRGLLEATAYQVKALCKHYDATFIIDDHVQLVKRVGADGVHLGKNDMSVAQARKILGDNFIIGGTVNSFEDVLHHFKGVAPDYFGCGPFRFTTTKKRLAPILGIEGYKNIIAKMREQGISIPIVAIGGIRKEDISDILACGVDGIALSGTIINAHNPVEEMQHIADKLSTYIKQVL